MKKSRFVKLKAELDKLDIDAFLVSNLINIKYLTGFLGTHAFLLILDNRRFLFTDSRYYERAQKEAGCVNVVLVSNNWPDILLKYGFKKLAFEADSISYGTFRDWKKKLKGIKMLPKRNIVENVRQIKDKDEIKLIKRAVKITDDLVRNLCFKPGITEEELAEKIEDRMLEEYNVRPSFPIIAAFGHNTSMPHAKPGNKKLSLNQMLYIDLGVQFKGYSSDLTRTFRMGKITGRFSKIYNIVLTAQKSAIEGIKPGLPACGIDALARDYIKKSGYGKYFGHSLGHGIGLSVHELPRINYKNKEKLEKGMVFSIEPGIYIPGWGGVRIEDLVLVTDNGCEVLTKSPKELDDIRK